MVPAFDQRYQALRPLGEGAEGSVWLARDRDHPGLEVAIKTLAAEAPRPEGLRHEFSLLRRLRHPGLAQVLDLRADYRGAPFLVMERVEGTPLDRWWTTVPLDEALEAFSQLMSVLDFIHRRGVIHRDVKPANVLAGSSKITLVDFGLAAVVARAGGTGGTLGYLAPEVLRGGAPSPQSDLYSVGVMLHLLLWGRLPEREGSALSPAPPPPASGVPETLRRLAGHLLAADPALRPASGAQAIELLQGAAGWAPHRTAAVLVGHGLPEPALVGRDPELSQIRALLAEAARGERAPTGVLVISGPGQGRTRLCAEVADLARLEGFRVLDVETQPMAAPLDPADGPDSVSQTRSAGEPAAEAAAAVSRLVQAICEQPGPALLLADELEEGLAAQVIRALCQGEPRPLFICAAARAGQSLERDISALLRPISLGPLSAQETSALAASVLPTGWASEELCARLHALCGGAPGQCMGLLVIAVREVAAKEGAIGLAESVEQAAASAEVVSGSRLRLCALTAEQHLAGGRLSLFPGGIEREAFCRLFSDTAPAALDGLVLQGVVVQDERGDLQLADRPLALALLEQLEVNERRASAARALAELEARRASALERARVAIRGDLAGQSLELVLSAARAARARGQLVESAELLTAASGAMEPRHPQRLDTLEALVAVLLALGQSATAAAHLQRALSTCRPGERPKVAAALADLHQKAGRGQEALAALSLISPRELAQSPGLQLVRSRVLMVLGRNEEARTAAEAAARLATRGHDGDCAGGDDDGIAAEATYLMGLAQYQQGQLQQAAAELSRAEELARGHEPLLRARIANALAMVHQRRSAFDEATACYQRALSLARALGHLPFEATLLMNLGAVAQQQGDPAAALACYQASLEVATSFGGRRELAQVLHNLARLYAFIGHPARSEGCLQRSLATCEALGWTSLTAYNLLLVGEIALDAGRLDEARDSIARAKEMFDRLGDQRGSAEAALARARWRAARGERDEAAALLERISVEAPDVDAVSLRALSLRGIIELERSGGDARRALTHLRAALRLAEDSAELEPLAELHASLARAYREVGDAAQAESHRASARQLLVSQRAALPADLREAFSATPLRRDLLGEPALPERDRSSGAPALPRQPAAAALDPDLLVAILEINKELNAEPDLKRLLERIIDHAVELAGAERGFLIMDRKPKMAIEVARNIDQEIIRNKVFKISRSIAEEVLGTGRPVVASDAMGDSRFEEFLSVHNLRLRSIVCVPLTVRRLVRGAIYLDNRFQVEAFTERHVALLSALADQAGLAVGNWELYEQDRERQAELGRKQQELAELNRRLEAAMEQQSLRLEELERLAESQRGELAQRYRFDNLVGQSAALREVFRLMERIKDTDVPVLIQGESGTGKELVARALHFCGHRKAGAFVAVNCGAIPATLLESELFGYDRGAFTGAHKAHQGLFQRADGGTLFLDEVGEMPLELQVKLLRVLQDKRFTRLGGEEEQRSDFRVVAASNKDLRALVAEGRFREDLLFRVHVIRLDLPPLRRRREDIPELIPFFLQKHGAADRRFTREALRLLMDYAWPGNVRELENEIQRAIALAGTEVRPEDLSPRICQTLSASTPSSGVAVGQSLKDQLAACERHVVVQALQSCQGSVKAAAERLQLTRVGLHKLLKRQGIDRFGEPLALETGDRLGQK